MKKISTAIEFLENAFDVLNARYFESALSKTIITIQDTPNAYGHYTPWESWQETNGTGYHEINLGAGTLDRPIAAIVATLLHEMTHHYCDSNGIKDTSRNGHYHNKRFKVEAEKRDLIITYEPSIGWSRTTPSDGLIAFCEEQGWSGIDLKRLGTGGSGKIKRKPSSTRKYVCPCCGQSVRATKSVNIIYGDCDEQMMCENDAQFKPNEAA